MTPNFRIVFGPDEYGNDLTIDLLETGHLLIAGCTGSGKSSLLHRIITTFIDYNSPEDVRLMLIDPKRVELTLYDNIPHQLTPTIVDPKKAILALKWASKEIDRRYEVLKKEGVTDIQHHHGAEKMPHILIVVDEFSDLMQQYPKETESSVLKIASLGHAFGVHLVLSTSRPSSKVYTRAVQDAFTTRIALQTASAADSKLIIGANEALSLRGAGDMLFRRGSKYIIRAQVSPHSTAREIQTLCGAIMERYKNFDQNQLTVSSSTSDESETDDMYEEAKRIVIEAGKASTSFIQRKLGIGYSRSAKLMDMLERNEVIGPVNGEKPRTILKK